MPKSETIASQCCNPAVMIFRTSPNTSSLSSKTAIENGIGLGFATINSLSFIAPL